jgi:hypothetical protein
MHDTTLSVLDIRAMDMNEGAEVVTLAMITAIQTPFAGPDGQPVPLVSGVYKVPMGKQAALELAASLTEAAEKLPDPKPQSNLVVPGSMQDAERIANDLGRFTS